MLNRILNAELAFSDWKRVKAFCEKTDPDWEILRIYAMLERRKIVIEWQKMKEK